MAITVEIVSRETVKPSTPTPPQLRSYKLSWMDQNHPLHHLPVIFFYSAAPSAAADDDVRSLKSSLSTALASFYPLAGRLSGNSLVDCGDQGVNFFEARAPDADLSEILSSDEPDLDELKKFLPCGKGEASCCHSEPTVTLSVQATVFRCGGIAVGVCISHKIADGCSLFLFLQAWAAAARGSFSPEKYSPSFDAAAVFPPDESIVPLESQQAPDKPPQVQRRLVLDGPRIAALREKTATTRFQAVAGLVLRCAVRARPRARPALAAVAVDTRLRMEPQSPNGPFGNRCIAAVAGIPLDEIENIRSGWKNPGNATYAHEAAMGAAVKRVDAEYVRRLQAEDGWKRQVEMGWEAVLKCGGATEAGFDMNIFSSWLRLPVYEVDFGWGPAAWAYMSQVPLSAVSVLPRPPAAGDPQGVEIWASLEQDEMAELQRALDELVPLNPAHHVSQPSARIYVA